MFLVDMTGSLNEILESIMHHEKIFRIQTLFQQVLPRKGFDCRNCGLVSGPSCHAKIKIDFAPAPSH
jgi:hypothetical protein